MAEFLKFIFGNFWAWLGFILVIVVILGFIFKVYNRTLRHRNILKHGYPEGTDADGDFPASEEDHEFGEIVRD